MKSKQDDMPKTVAVLFLLFSVIFLFFSIPDFINGILSYFWQTTEAEIIHSTVRRTTVGVDDKPCRFGEIRYRYAVKGRIYQNDKIDYISEFLHLYSRHTDEVADNPVGKRTKIYYDPDNPQNSVLLPGVTLSNCIMVSLASLFFLMGLAGLFTSSSDQETPLELTGIELRDQDLIDILAAFREKIADPNLFLYPDFTAKRFNNARIAFAANMNCTLDPPLIQVDESITGNGKKGCLVTKKYIYSDQFDNREPVPLSSIDDVHGTATVFEKKIFWKGVHLLTFTSIKKKSLFLLADLINTIRRGDMQEDNLS